MVISKVTAAIEELWGSLQVMQPELPDVTILCVIDDSLYGGLYRDENVLVISTIALDEGPRMVFDVVLHEAAHALAYARGINDLHGEHFHNQRYAAVAAWYFGLTVRWQDSELGWNLTKSRHKTRKMFKRELKNLKEAMR